MKKILIMLMVGISLFATTTLDRKVINGCNEILQDKVPTEDNFFTQGVVMGAKEATQIDLIFLHKKSYKGIDTKEVCSEFLSQDTQTVYFLIFTTRSQFLEKNAVATDSDGKIIADTLDDDIQELLDEDLFGDDEPIIIR
jgi:hypothetical protein